MGETCCLSTFTPFLSILTKDRPSPHAVMVRMASTVLYLILFTVIGRGGGGGVAGNIPTTLDGPFEPVTVPLDQAAFRGNAVDLPDTDHRVQRKVPAFFPEQISISLSASYDSVWISWVTGEFQIGGNVKPLNPASVKSVVYYGRLRNPLNHEATGYSLVYDQLYPFEGLRNYTSGIIHHVRLTGPSHAVGPCHVGLFLARADVYSSGTTSRSPSHCNSPLPPSLHPSNLPTP